MVLNIIGIGLSDENDITLRGLELLRTSKKIYLESYTAILSPNANIFNLVKDLNIDIIEADRKLLEEGCEDILDESLTINVSLIVVGDPFCATTHSYLILRAMEKSIKVNIVHNASIFSAIGTTGLQLYKFGEVVSIPFFEENWRPDSFYDKLKNNLKMNLHTLCLLDIKVKEQTIYNLLKNNNIYEKPRFMTINQAIDQLLEVEKTRGESIITDKTICFGVARLGSLDQVIVSGYISELISFNFGLPLHSLIICNNDLHLMEKQFFDLFHISNIK